MSICEPATDVLRPDIAFDAAPNGSIRLVCIDDDGPDHGGLADCYCRIAMSHDQARYLAAEKRLWDSVGVETTEITLGLPTIGSTVRAQEVGEGPPLVFIHGGATGGASWAMLVSRLTDFRCIVIDRPGMGLSELPPNVRRRDMAQYKSFADALLPDIVDALEVPNVQVASTSLGGFCAFRGAATAPDKVQKIIEFSYPIGAPMQKVPMVFRMAGLPGADRISAAMPANRTIVKAALSSAGLKSAIRTGKFNDQAIEWMVSFMNDTPSMQNETGITPRFITPIAGLNDETIFEPELLANLTMPIHFFWGADDPNGGEATANLLVNQLPNATLEMVPSAGHAPWLDELDRAEASTRAFLNS